jgi:hypothetical protein
LQPGARHPPRGDLAAVVAVSAIVAMPARRGMASAASTLPEPPLVEIASSASPCRAVRDHLAREHVLEADAVKGASGAAQSRPRKAWESAEPSGARRRRSAAAATPRRRT